MTQELRIWSAALVLSVVGCVQACSAAQKIDPNERVKLELVGIRAACGECIRSSKCEVDLVEICKTFVEPPAVSEAVDGSAQGSIGGAPAMDGGQ
jgi:hypothetical protein